jgi:phenylalanyl-tRNA synthetase beta chain
MLVSYNWLKEFVDLTMTPERTAEVLTMGGVEVEAVSHVGGDLFNVYTARVAEVLPHPSASHLRLARIDAGDRSETVVCGAPNLRLGDIVPYAAPGAVMPSGAAIEVAEIRGVESVGMLCSEKELDLGDDASGLLVFDAATPVGKPLPQALPFIEDYILETSVTPNRGDCLSVLGLAREIAALSGGTKIAPKLSLAESSISIFDRIRVEVPDPELCPRYVLRLVEGVRVGPSPFDVRLRLKRAGLRPISNVVDATNLILLECGQPLHAFDYALLEDARIVVRRCDPGEVFVTLDGTERRLPPDSLMIRDGGKSVALAGIMGGVNSEIGPDTTSVLIESACFERFGVRRTAKTLGMGTEASFRFERGVDPEGTLWAAHRAAQVIQRLAGGVHAAGVIDVYPSPIVRTPVEVRIPRVNRVLGTSLEKKEIVRCLERLDIKTEKKSPQLIRAIPPSWRWDLEREVDMIEEIARIHGFEKIPVSTPRQRAAPDGTRDEYEATAKAATVMNACGFTEVITMSFVAPAAAEEFIVDEPFEGSLALLNPLTEDGRVMRTSLAPGILGALKRNLTFRNEDLRLYEIGRTFIPQRGEALPREDVRLAACACGRRLPDLWHFRRGEVDVKGNLETESSVDFYDMKGAIENLLEAFGVEDAAYRPTALAFLHPGKSADILVGSDVIGYVGELSPSKLREHDLPFSVYVFEVFLKPVVAGRCRERLFKPLPRYPYVERDLSIIVEEKVSGDVIKRLISRVGRDIIASVILFDFYRGESIPEGSVSMAFRIRYQSEDRTLTDEEVQKVHTRVVETLSREVGSSLRQ